MYKFLCPRLTVNSLYDIDLTKLHARGIRGIIFDLDNTIIPWDSEFMPADITSWLQEAMAKGFRISLVSNNYRKRVEDIASMLGIPFVCRAFKPAKTGFRQAISAMRLSNSEVAVVGDQLFTDMLGGNRLGLFTIWVKPLSVREFAGTKITRQLEKITVHILRKKGLLKG